MRAVAALMPLMAELSLLRMDTSTRGVPVLFGRGGSKADPAGATAALFGRGVGKDDPAGAAAAAAGGRRHKALVVSLFAGGSKMEGTKG